MPADQSEERKSAMAAFGAELISVPSSSDGGGMEAARDLASKMQVSPCPQYQDLQLTVLLLNRRISYIVATSRDLPARFALKFV